jgi:uncharacterized peroxidase-related enzyme
VPYIAVPDDLPGIVGLMASKPASGRLLNALAEQILRGPSPLSHGERELIAALVSSRNETTFCLTSHSAAAAHALGDAWDVVAAVRRDHETAPVSETLRALLAIAATVQQSGRAVRPADVERARAAGAGDEAIHDTVLVAAAFCMFNRYVDGLDATTPTDDAAYDLMGKTLATEGYDRGQLDAFVG